MFILRQTHERTFPDLLVINLQIKVQSSSIPHIFKYSNLHSSFYAITTTSLIKPLYLSLVLCEVPYEEITL